MPSSNNNPKLPLLIVAGCVVALLMVVWPPQRKPNPAPLPPVSAATPRAAESPASNPPSPIAVPAAAPVSAAANSPSQLQQACEMIRGATDRDRTRHDLAELRNTLAAMPKDAAVSAIREFLDSKTDAPTHLGFKVANNGTLDDAPTLRTFLLDELGRLDPAAAADYAGVILASKDSPDEWALALRNLARGDTSDAGRSLLQQKTGELLQYAAWQQDPSVGYLEAFDTAVYLGGANLMPALSDLVKRQDNPAVAHAAFLALDRLVINDPATALAALATDPTLMQSRESTRADYFARADVRDPQQKQILENYLLNPQTSPAEIGAFAGIYPNANFMISANLLTQSSTPDHASLMGRDAAALSVAQSWLADPRFANLQSPLMRITSRLQEFARQSAGGP